MNRTAARAFLVIALALTASSLPAGATTLIALQLPTPVPLAGTLLPAPASIDVAPDGSAIAAWLVLDSINFSWYPVAALYAPSAGWSAPHLLSINPGTFGEDPRVAIDSEGNAAVVWTEGSAGAFVAVYRPAGGWTGAKPLVNDTGVGGEPRVAALGDGTFAFAWLEYEANNSIGFFEYYTASDGFDFPQNFTTPAETPTHIALAGDESGNATIVWSLDAAGSNSVWSRNASLATGWSDASYVGDPFPPNAINSLAVDQSSDGTSVVAFSVVYSASFLEVYAAVRAPSSDWPGPAEGVCDGVYSNPAAAALGNGGAAILCSRDIGSYSYLDSRTFNAKTGWTRETIDGSALPTTPAIASGSPGNASALWVDGQWPDARLRMAALSEGEGWTGPVTLLSGNEVGGVAPALGADASGHALALFTTPDYRLQFARFALAPTLVIKAPADLSTVGALNVYVEIEADPGATLSGGWLQGTVGATGHVSQMVAVQPGLNTIAVTATDAYGRSSSATTRVYVDGATANLTGDLDEARLEINRTSALVDDLQGQINQTRLEFNDTVDELDRMQDRLDAMNDTNGLTLGQLANLSLELNLEIAKGEILKGNVEALSKKIQQNEADLARTAGATTFGLGGLLAGIAGVALGALSMLRGRGSTRAQATQGAEPAKAGDHDKGAPPPPRG